MSIVNFRHRIFDFDDWNDHAVANYRPFLTSDSLDSSISASWEFRTEINKTNLGGRITENLFLDAESGPYTIRSDITVMPDAVLTILPGVVMEFAPNVGILVLGTLRAIGRAGAEIIMRPINDEHHTSNRRETSSETIRLCKEEKCSQSTNEGIFFNC